MDDTEIFYALQASQDTKQLEHDAEYAKQAAMAFFLAGIEHARPMDAEGWAFSPLSGGSGTNAGSIGISGYE